MTQYLRFIACLLLFCISKMEAQQLISDDHLTHIPVYSPPFSSQHNSYLSRSIAADTLIFSANQPFFDDFSSGSSIPDSSKWCLRGSEKYPIISKRMAVRPPSQGVATFDGVNSKGQAYVQESLAAGEADALRTHCIDLSGFNASDNIKLSFFLQPQGLGNAPDNIAPGNVDEFNVYLADSRDPGSSGRDNLRKVFSIPGTPLKEFRQYVIPIDNPAYFHSGFYILFENKGALYGYLDQWHLDYVYMAPNRSNADTTYNDVSTLYLESSPLSPYTAIPFEQYKGGNFMQPFQAIVSNLDGRSVSAAVDAQIIEGLSQTGFPTGNRLVEAVNLSPFARNTISFDGGQFLDQNILNNASYQLDLDIESGDARPQNDKIREIFRIDSVYAYDDGEADASFGLNKSRGFGVRFDLEKPDSLVAIWMSFVPTLNCRTNDCGGVEYMENIAFRLTIWKNEHPDSTMYRQISGSRVRYGDSLNHFERFPLDIIQGVPQRFWIGIQQLSSRPIGVGYDLSYNNDAYTYWDSAGHWVNASFGGSLMIRAEMKNGRDLSTAIFPVQQTDVSANIYPNPLNGRNLTVQFSDQANFKSHKLSLWNLQGQQVYSSPILYQGQMLRLPATLSSGIFLVKHEFDLKNGRKKIQTDKLLIH